MKRTLLIQMIILALVLGGVGVAYWYYPPFKQLTLDVIDAAGWKDEQTSPVAKQDMPADSQIKPPISVMPPRKTPVETYPAYTEQPAVPSKVDSGNTGDGYRPLDSIGVAEAESVPAPAPATAPDTSSAAKTKAEVMQPAVKPVAQAEQPIAPPAVQPAPPVEMPREEDRPQELVPASSPEQQALKGLSQAREAWSSGQTEQAIAQYQQLMKDYPNHPDFSGELGNIYYGLGKSAQAVDAYTETFHRLIRMEDYQRAWQILNVIRYMDYQRASQLEQYFVR